MNLLTTLTLLIVVLGLGTIYAWYQFAQVVIKRCDTCSSSLKENPLKSKCFVGAIFFTIAFVLAIYAFTLL